MKDLLVEYMLSLEVPDDEAVDLLIMHMKMGLYPNPFIGDRREDTDYVRRILARRLIDHRAPKGPKEEL